MAIQLCESCSAPLPLATPGSIVNCKHCDVDNFIKDQKTKKQSSSSKYSRPSYLANSSINLLTNNSKKTGCTGIATLLVLLIVLPVFFILTYVNRDDESTNSNNNKETEYISNNDLPGLCKSGYEIKDIDPQGMPGSLSDFKISETIQWITNLAKHWSPDVLLYLIKIYHYPTVGEYNLSTDSKASLLVRFMSPAKLEINKKMSEVSEDQIPWMFEIKISHDGIRVTAHELTTSGYSSNEASMLDSFCPLAEILETMKKGGLEPRPKYDFSLQYDQYDNNWFWRASGTNIEYNGRISAKKCMDADEIYEGKQ